MNCNKLGQYIIDYVLAWKVGLDILRDIAIKEAQDVKNNKYVSFLKKNGFSFPEISKKFAGADYEVQAIQALYLTVPQHYVKFAEQRGLFFLANMFFLIEKFTRIKYDLRQAIAARYKR